MSGKRIFSWLFLSALGFGKLFDRSATSFSFFLTFLRTRKKKRNVKMIRKVNEEKNGNMAAVKQKHSFPESITSSPVPFLCVFLFHSSIVFHRCFFFRTF